MSIVFQDVATTAILPKPLAEKYLVSRAAAPKLCATVLSRSSSCSQSSSATRMRALATLQQLRPELLQVLRGCQLGRPQAPRHVCMRLSLGGDAPAAFLRQVLKCARATKYWDRLSRRLDPPAEPAQFPTSCTFSGREHRTETDRERQ